MFLAGRPRGSMSSPRAQQTPLAALQSMEAQAGVPDAMYPPSSSNSGTSGAPFMKEMYVSVDKRLEQAKLRELLTQESEGLREGTGLPGGAEDWMSGGQMPSANRLCSPEPAMPNVGASPTQSSPQQPQSTSTEEVPDSSSKDIGRLADGKDDADSHSKEENVLLKQLLSQNDDEEASEQLISQSYVSETSEEEGSAQRPSSSQLPLTAERLADMAVEMEKNNEAEPKKTDNFLLKVIFGMWSAVCGLFN